MTLGVGSLRHCETDGWHQHSWFEQRHFAQDRLGAAAVARSIPDSYW